MSLVKRAVLLVSGERYLVLSITLCQTALVSRLLTPQEVGLSMLGVALVQVIDGLRDFGTTNYIIHEPTTSRQSARTAFTVLLALSLVFAWCCSPRPVCGRGSTASPCWKPTCGCSP